MANVNNTKYFIPLHGVRMMVGSAWSSWRVAAQLNSQIASGPQKTRQLPTLSPNLEKHVRIVYAHYM